MESATALRNDGAALFVATKYADAAPKFEAALSAVGKLKDSDEKKALILSCTLNLASCCVLTKKFPEAVEWASQALDIDRKNSKAMYRRGQAYREMGQYSKARFELMMASEITKDDPLIVEELALLRAQTAANPTQGQSEYSSPVSMPASPPTYPVFDMAALQPQRAAPAPAVEAAFDATSYQYPPAAQAEKSKADGGDPRAMNKLGDGFDDGKDGLPKNKAAAFFWYNKAALSGDAQGQNNLAWCYKTGTGVAANPTTAISWYEKAADQGYTKAFAALGYCYEKGDGVASNPAKALGYYTKAADANDTVSMANLALMFEKGLGIDKNEVEALKWHTRAASNGNVNAQINVGLYYEKGIGGVAKDMKQAFGWYEKAANAGDHTGQTILGCCYEKGEGVPADTQKALMLYMKAAMQGNQHAKQGLQRLKEQ